MSDSVTNEWIKAAVAGEEAAWGFLYRQYYPIVYSLALKLCGSSEFAKDVVQETFITAWLKIHQLHEPRALESWLKKILKRHYFRRLQVKTNGIKYDIPADSLLHDEINEKVDETSSRSRLYLSLAQLPEGLRSAMLLRYYTRFQSYEAIAAILAIPVGTVRSRLSSARLKLAARWEENKDAGSHIFHESEEWNHFYRDTFAGLHTHDDLKNLFLLRLRKDMKVVINQGKPVTGPVWIETLIADDRKTGSWFKPAEVQTCGNLSIVEVNHFNSSEYPDRCPRNSVCVLRRDKGRITEMHLYNSPK